ncbi:MAG TPA: PQQ-dependent sugar dehydrogenase [Rhodocyclaceae bacterium]|nr:sorbosone dehydrogenase family protein [Betaproteobacteria bacterium]HMV00806.1 PQQ-dependent sugar dehydrogenase [Rhodocyclaceae bacterium]HMV21022.1 PQQ-dependent sugar dehydrogenase [Rhodocyclaceae bacterium]HMW77568.1 PQQ-dependent sugar dehydrogenase [Rhodocyclaceae bacterium]HNE42469.1 PQQ-dependent sugar dehydrogenase [Rhodocyclaceae bacterium]
MIFLPRCLGRQIVFGCLALLLGGGLSSTATAVADLPVESLRLPPGFALETVARVPNARAMTRGAGRIVYVGSRDAGRVYAVEFDSAWRHGRARVIASGLELPVGVAWRNGDLYISAVNRILRLEGIDARLDDPPRAKVVFDQLPRENAHGWKFIAFGPDGWLYLAVGAPCNICDPDARYASIFRLRPDGSVLESVARGVRNSVGFDWHPGTGEMWFTDNGRDGLGDDTPPDELNRLVRPGQHFGYPYCHAGTIPDPEFGSGHSCADFESPAIRLGAHVAPLGLRFYRGATFPAAYRGQILIAEHGSWNRSRKAGYRISLVRLEGGRAVAYEPFVTGWLQGESPWGRPADILELPDGSLLVSDDLAGALYRITYTPPRNPTP